jgi:hypothetical protein
MHLPVLLLDVVKSEIVPDTVFQTAVSEPDPVLGSV